MTAQARPLWKRLAFPAFLAVLVAGGIWGAMLASRDPQAHAHGPLEKLLWRPVEAFNFRLTGPDGNPVELKDYRGKTVFFAFGFTHCPSICPATLSHFAAIKDALPERVRDKVQFIFVSVDPERDKPERLKEFVGFYDSAFLGLTGDSTALQSTAYKFKASYSKVRPAEGDPVDYSVDHTADAYLIGPDGMWVMSYPFEELVHADEIAKDIVRVSEK